MIKTKFFTAVLLLLLLSALGNTHHNQVSPTDLRGLVLTFNPTFQQWVPLQSASVDLYFWNGQQWLLIAQTITDAYGYYFIRSIDPNFYSIQINRMKNYNIQVIPIDRRYYSFQDLPVLYY